MSINSFKNLFISLKSQINSLIDYIRNFFTKTTDFLVISFRKISNFFTISPEKMFFLQKNPAFNEELSSKLENLLSQRKINEFLDIMKQMKDFSSIKAMVFTTFFDILLEISNVTIAFEMMKLLIKSDFAHLNKKIISNFFTICYKLRQSNLAVYLFQFFESHHKKDLNISEISGNYEGKNELSLNFEEKIEKIENFDEKIEKFENFDEKIEKFENFEEKIENFEEKNENFEEKNEEKMNILLLSPISHHSFDRNADKTDKNSSKTSVFFLMNRYFILTMQKLGETSLAISQFSHFLQNITNNAENIKIIYKMFEELIKGLIISNSPINSFSKILNFLHILTIKPNDIFFNKLIDFSSKSGFIDLSELLFETMPNISISPTIVTYNTLIFGYFSHKTPGKAWILFEKLKKSIIKPDNFTYTIMINGLKNLKDFDLNIAFQLFEEYKLFNKPDQIIYNCLLDACVNSNNFEKAREILKEIKGNNRVFQGNIARNSQGIYKGNNEENNGEKGGNSKGSLQNKNVFHRNSNYEGISKGNYENYEGNYENYEGNADFHSVCDEITYNTLIKGCCRTKQLTEAIGFFEEMKSSGIKPNRITFNSLIDCCVKAGKMTIAWRFYDELLRNAIIPDNFTYSILINGIKTNFCDKSNNLDFCDKSNFSQKSNNFSNKEELLKTISFFEKIAKNADFKPDEILYNSLMDACVKFNEINKALSLFEEMTKKGIEPSAITYGILIKAYGKMNDLVKAFKVFETIKLKELLINDVTYGCLLDACVKNNRIDLAVILFQRIKDDKIPLNTILYTTLIKGFNKANKLTEALAIFEKMKENVKTLPNLITYNCIIDACLKGNSFEKALELYGEMQGFLRIKPDLITFSTLIKGFTRSGQLKVAFDLFCKMIEKKIWPDDPLVNLMMDSCFIGRNCEIGIRVYEKLVEIGVTFTSISYGIIIKLLGQAKRFNQAMNILSQMKQKNMKPGVIIYTNLLQICFNMRKVDHAVQLFEKMQQENIQTDHVCFTKLINGAMFCGKLELAYSFYEKSALEKITLNPHVYLNLFEEIKASKINDKDKIMEILKKNLENPCGNNESFINNSRFLKEKTTRNFDGKSLNLTRNDNKSRNFDDKSMNLMSNLDENINPYQSPSNPINTHQYPSENRRIPFENKQEDFKNNENNENFNKKRVFEEKNVNHNKENKDNFNFRVRNQGDFKAKPKSPPMFIGNKANNTQMNQNDLLITVNPKNL